MVSANMDEEHLVNFDGIITLQVGHYSNFIGTHWWNIQHSSRRSQPDHEGKSQIEHGLFFREESDLGRGRQILTPRLLCIDLRGSLKCLKEDGSFKKDTSQHNKEKISLQSNLNNDDGDNDDNEMHVDDNVAPCDLSIHKTETIKRLGFVSEEQTVHENVQDSNYFNLNDVVEVWSDFLGNDYHQKSVLLLDHYWHNSNSFSSFGQGFAINESQTFWDSWEDKMHFFAEECDRLQGFQMLIDIDDGFGGLAIRTLENLQDCYGQKSVAIYGSWPGIPNKDIDENTQFINSALTVGHITQHNSLFVPLSLQEKYFGKENVTRKFQHLSYKPESHYQTSAILASFLDSISLRYRTGNASLGNFCSNSTITGHTIASANLSLPLPIKEPCIDNAFKETNLYGNGWMKCLTPSDTKLPSNLYSQQMVLRGLPCEYELVNHGSSRFKETVSNKRIFELHVFDQYRSYKTGTTFCEEPLPTIYPYPRYFDSTVGRDGYVQRKSEKHSCVNHVPALASLIASDGVFDLLLDIINSADKAKRSDYMLMEQYGIEKDEINENMEQLKNVAYLYDDKRASELF